MKTLPSVATATHWPVSLPAVAELSTVLGIHPSASSEAVLPLRTPLLSFSDSFPLTFKPAQITSKLWSPSSALPCLSQTFLHFSPSPSQPSCLKGLCAPLPLLPYLSFIFSPQKYSFHHLHSTETPPLKFSITAKFNVHCPGTIISWVVCNFA